MVIHSIKYHKLSLKFYLYLLILKFNFFIRKFANEIVVASSFLEEKYGGHIFPVPIDVEFFSKNKRYDLTKKYGKNIILFAGTIQRCKGIDYLVEAFPYINKKIKDAKLIFIGHTKLGSPVFA